MRLNHGIIHGGTCLGGFHAFCCTLQVGVRKLSTGAEDGDLDHKRRSPEVNAGCVAASLATLEEVQPTAAGLPVTWTAPSDNEVFLSAFKELTPPDAHARNCFLQACFCRCRLGNSRLMQAWLCCQAAQPSSDGRQVSEAAAANSNSRAEPAGIDGGTVPAADGNAGTELGDAGDASNAGDASDAGDRWASALSSSVMLVSTSCCAACGGSGSCALKAAGC